MLEIMLPNYQAALERTLRLPEQWCLELDSRISQIWEIKK